jgi:hypothetical protein
MTNREDMAEVKSIQGIQITDSIKYLRVKLFCEKSKTIRSIKD